jgi:hypothetical protein
MGWCKSRLSGNHEASSIARQELVPMLNIPESTHPPPEHGAGYYTVVVTPGVRIVAIDTYDVSAAGYPDDHPKKTAAAEMIAKGKAWGPFHPKKLPFPPYFCSWTLSDRATPLVGGFAAI